MLGVGNRGKGHGTGSKERVRSTKAYFGPPVARLRRPSSGRGILNGSSPLGECTDPNSDRVRCRCCPVGHLFLRDDTEKEGKLIKTLQECLQGCPYCASADAHGILSA